MATPPKLEMWCRRAAVAACCWFSVLFAEAHDPFEITAGGRVRSTQIELKVTMARTTAAAAALADPAVKSFAPEQLEELRSRLEAGAADFFAIALDDAPLAFGTARVGLDPEDDVDFFLTFPKPAGGRSLRLIARIVERLPDGYAATIAMHTESGEVVGPRLLTSELSTLVVPLATESGGEASPEAGGQFSSFFALGLEHILTGYDHLLFLGALLVACRRMKTMVGIVTCFTVAHSLTLALAALGVVSIPGRIVEPLIAASIVFVAVENLLRREEPKHRWLLTFAFGLVHGFGFAGVLQETALGSSGAALVVPLFAFNLGVEAGQLAVAAVLLPVLWAFRARSSYARYAQPAISAVVALAGTWWFVERVLPA